MAWAMAAQRASTVRAEALRSAATSGRSCSAACAVFFEADVTAVEKPPHRADANRHAALPQHASQLGQRHIRRLLDLVQKEPAMRLDPHRAPVSVLGPGTNVALRVPSPNPADRTRHADTELRQMARMFIDTGHEDAIMRLWHEPEIPFKNWCEQPFYHEAWQHVHDVFMSEFGADFIWQYSLDGPASGQGQANIAR